MSWILGAWLDLDLLERDTVCTCLNIWYNYCFFSCLTGRYIDIHGNVNYSMTTCEKQENNPVFLSSLGQSGLHFADLGKPAFHFSDLGQSEVHFSDLGQPGLHLPSCNTSATSEPPIQFGTSSILKASQYLTVNHVLSTNLSQCTTWSVNETGHFIWGNHWIDIRHWAKQYLYCNNCSYVVWSLSCSWFLI